MKKTTILIVILTLSKSILFGQRPVKSRKDSTNNVFTLGEVNVTTKTTANYAKVVNEKQLQTFAKNNVATSLNLLPGITIAGVGPRNESTVYLRGFDLTQIPLLIDGIPVYVPYDGYVDLARFTTFDLSEIQVSKNYTSVNYGPNSLGGAINLITQEPVKPFEFNGATGWQNGGYRSNINIGSKFNKFYIQAGASKFKRNYFPLSNDFVATKNQAKGKRDNSYSNDEKFNIKLAYTPNEKSEYALNYIYQHGSKGTPVYVGNDTLNSLYAKPRFWQWPKWDKRSLYFLSNTNIGNTQYLKTRLYYDKFINVLSSFDDGTYSTMTKPYAFKSFYNDYTLGGIVEYGKEFGNIDNIVTSLQYKEDVHREHDAGEPIRTLSDRTSTAAIENQLNITPKLLLHTGISFNNRASIKAQDYNSSLNTISDFPSNNNNAFNLQGALDFNPNKNNKFSFSVARKTRFATTKDRYSYHFGTVCLTQT